MFLLNIFKVYFVLVPILNVDYINCNIYSFSKPCFTKILNNSINKVNK